MMGRGAEGGSHKLVGSSSIRGSNATVDIYSQLLNEVVADDASRENPEHPGEVSFPVSLGSYSVKGAVLLDNKRKNRAKKTQPRSRDSKPVGKHKHHADYPPSAGDAPVGLFWTQMDDYFRDVTTSDVQLLLPTTSFQFNESGNVVDHCLLIPPVGRHYTEKWAEEDLQQADLVVEQSVPRPKRKLPSSGPTSKKNKKSGELITVISPPLEHEDGEELCHVCNCGDSDESNHILFCDSCNVAVHQDCYGVRPVPEGQWLCSWCSWKSSMNVESCSGAVVYAPTLVPLVCVLCPSKGGALKPVVEVDSKETIGRRGTKFAHLFCSQWVPETFIGNMEVMEPIRNIEGVRDERWRLLCSICKEKHGACIQCSHGMCATAFHPLCAREAKYYMEVCSMEDSEDIEYRSYCSKHSAAHMGKASVIPNEDVDAGTSQLKLTDAADNATDVDARTSNEPSDEKSHLTDIMNKEKISPESGNPVVEFEKFEDHGSKFRDPTEERFEQMQPSDRVQQGFEQDSHLAASPSFQSWEALQPLSDTADLFKQAASKCNVMSGDEIEEKSSLIKSDHSDLRCSIASKEGITGQGVLAVAEDHASGEVATACDNKGGEEQQQRSRSVEHGKETPSPAIGIEGLEEDNSNPEATHSDKQHKEELQKDVPQSFAHPQIEQRLRHLLTSESNRQLSDIDHPIDKKSSKAPTRAFEGGATDSLEEQWEQLRAADKEGVLKLAPSDEIEGEILVLQNSLLDHAVENRLNCEMLIAKLMPKLSEERALSLKRAKELDFVHRYMSQKREVKKQGRKEKRHKEAQAVLAAATAAAAASPRVGYIKRDALSLSDIDNQPSSPSHEINFGYGSGVLSSSIRHFKPPVPRVGHVPSSSPHHPLSARSGYQARLGTELAVLRTGHGQSHLEGGESACDVCSSRESSRANKIVTCNSCKVNVHQECYGIGRIPPGVWFCQPCAELQRQSQSLRSPGVGGQANMLWAQCALCCRGAGALKRSTDGRWVHVFCAQWMPETSTGKDQASLIQGMENVNPERFALLCSVCQRQEGACLTCNFGHCHGAFHPPCARLSGLYMTVRVSAGGRLQYRAYCDRHSIVQRAKDEQVEQRQRSETEELHALRQIRVEFERVRLMCERICRRERLKRDMLQTTRDIIVAQLFSAGHTGMINLEQLEPAGMYRSDTQTVGGELSFASVQQMPNTHQLNPIVNSIPSEEPKEHTRRLKKVKKQHGRTRLHREQLMTPMEASILNMRLPKGYAYVPVDVYVKGTIAPTQADIVEKQQQQLPPTSLPP
ncbi:uncharacterized protein [Physcomitrium patens]|uniref:uncharacterized protein isoform X4 n=1 Tax=Physcomitrium patens TaxID=3218 RepID=UPI000D17ADD1|nr:uncharacterized protein LOC112288600 isoform X4 [Physcomitrium patens]|eukprot:XP_024388731.1 uncharacterized protein LOC112288600 isoform X4 [Physcomitrella patens]